MPSLRPVLRALFLVIAAAPLLMDSTAAAQGTSGTLPAPINSQQLMRYADRLELSGEQRRAMEAAHDEYRQQFRTLRDGEMSAFLEEQRSLQGGIPKRSAVEKLLEAQESIQGKIHLLDNQLFDQLLPILTDTQQSIVPRLRLARERARYEVQATAAAFGRRTPDLSEHFHDLELAPDVFTAADAMIASYERRMTIIMRKQNKAITSMTLDMMDVLAERGYAEISQEELLKDPELIKEVVGQVQEVYGDLRRKVAKLTDDVRELNQRTYRQVAAILPADEARSFRNAFYRETHPQLGAMVAQSEDDWITEALRLEMLTAEQRTILAAASDEHQRQLSQLLTAGAGFMDRFWEGFSPFEVNQERADKLRADLSDIQMKAAAAKTKAEEQVELQLGAETVKELRHELGKLAASAEPEAVADADGESETDATSQFAFSGDRFLPDRISRRDISRYMKQLQIDRDMTVVLDVLHRDYLEELSNLAVLDRLREARNDARSDADDDSLPPVRERIDHVFALRREAIEAMAHADAGFFDDLNALIGEEHDPLLERVRGSRLRTTYAGSATARLALGRDQSNEASVDVVSIVLAEQPSRDELERVGEALTAYEGSATAAFRARLEAQLDMQRLTDQLMTEIQAAASEDIGAVIDLQMRYRETLKAPTRSVERTNQAIVDLNRRALDQLLAELPARLAASIRRAYDLAAFPSIYNDPSSVERQLGAARGLGDLTDRQREQLTDLAGSYLDEYNAFSRQMIANLPASTVNAVALDPAAFRAWQERQQALARTKFDRNELNGRTISRMKTILTEEQVRRIGGLPEPLGEDDFFFYR